LDAQIEAGWSLRTPRLNHTVVAAIVDFFRLPIVLTPPFYDETEDENYSSCVDSLSELCRVSKMSHASPSSPMP
jgi:hypothetical protein